MCKISNRDICPCTNSAIVNIQCSVCSAYQPYSICTGIISISGHLSLNRPMASSSTVYSVIKIFSPQWLQFPFRIKLLFRLCNSSSAEKSGSVSQRYGSGPAPKCPGSPTYNTIICHHSPRPISPFNHLITLLLAMMSLSALSSSRS